MKDILRRNNPQYNSVERLLEKNTLGTPIHVSKSTSGSSFIPINNQKEISLDKLNKNENSSFKARFMIFWVNIFSKKKLSTYSQKIFSEIERLLLTNILNAETIKISFHISEKNRHHSKLKLTKIKNIALSYSLSKWQNQLILNWKFQGKNLLEKRSKIPFVEACSNLYIQIFK